MATQRTGDREERAVKLLTTYADQALSRHMYRDMAMFRNVLNTGINAKVTPGQLILSVFEAAVHAEAFIIQPKAAVATQGLRAQAQDRDGNTVSLNQLSIAFMPPAGLTTNATKFLDEKYTAEAFAHHRAALQSTVQQALMCMGEAFVLGVHSPGLNQQGFVSVYNVAVGLSDDDYQKHWPLLKAYSDLFDRNYFQSQLSDLVDPNSDVPVKDQLEAIIDDGKADGARAHIVALGKKASKMLDFATYHDKREWYFKQMESGAVKTSARTSSSSARTTDRSVSEELTGDEDIPF